MADLTLHISGTGTRNGRTEIISATHEHMEGILAFAWQDYAEHGDRFEMTCECYGMWNTQKFAAALGQMKKMLGREQFEKVFVRMLDLHECEVKEDGQDEQAGAD